jgi:hypothetical protein
MPTITGYILDGAGTGITSLALEFGTIGQASNLGASGVRSRGRVTAATTTGGAFSVVLAGGSWRMRWYRTNLINEIILSVPASGGPYTLSEVIDDEVVSPGSAFTWWTSIAALLAEDAADWTNAGTTNSYGSDGIISGWARILKTDPASTGLSDNGDSVLETDDGLAYAVRTWISG